VKEERGAVDEADGGAIWKEREQQAASTEQQERKSSAERIGNLMRFRYRCSRAGRGRTAAHHWRPHQTRQLEHGFHEGKCAGATGSCIQRMDG